MRTKFFMSLLLLIAAIDSACQSENPWANSINNPKKANGFVILDAPENLSVWKVIITKRTYVGSDYVDIVVHRETFNKINSYFIPSEFHQDSASHEFFYQILGLDTGGSVVYDSGLKPTLGDGTPMVHRRKWVCNGYDYAYEINLFSDASGTYGVISLDAPGYVYEFLRPSEIPCSPEFPENQLDYFYESHGVVPGFCSYISEPSAFNPSAFPIENNSIQFGAEYYDRDGYLITTPIIYAVSKSNWKWPSGSIFWDGISTGIDVLIQADIEYIISMLNLYSNIGDVSLDNPELYCDGVYSPISIDIPGSQASIIDCLIEGAAELVANPELLLSAEGNVLTLLDITDNCFETGGVTYLNGLDVVNIDKPNKPVSVVSLGREDLVDEFGDFTIPNFLIDKGTYWVSARFQNGKFVNFFMSSNKKTINSLQEAMLVDIIVAPVPISGDQFDVTVDSQINSPCIYEVFDNLGNLLYKTSVKLSKDSSIKFPVYIEQGIPFGNVIHRLSFSDGSVKTLNTIK